MPRRRMGPGRSAAIRASVALAVLAGCAGAVAYAATVPAPGRRAPSDAASATAARIVPLSRAAAAGVVRPRITTHPEKLTAEPSARFAFVAGGGRRAFQCRLDRGGWRGCRSPLRLDALAPGGHSFSVRVAAGRRRGPAAAYRWTVVEPKPVAVEPRLSALAPLYPGAAPQAVPVTIRNPNSVPVLVTAVQVRASASPPGCDGEENFELTPAGVSALAPLAIPAGGAVSLPAPGVPAPAIALTDLPVDQDACQGAQLPLLFSAEAHG